MFTTTKQQFFTWLYQKAMAVTNWSRMEMIRAHQPSEVPEKPLEVLFPVQDDPVEQGFIRKGEPVTTRTIDDTFAAFQQAANERGHGI
jgi:hypothetical protein